jgi:HlyD family secretion protein/macrolide-specific efflux system membrane fusion protein
MNARLLRVGATVCGVIVVAAIGWVARGAWQRSGDGDSSVAAGPSIVRVGRGSIEQTVRARGIVKPAPNALVRIGFPMPKDVSRRIRALRVIEGDTVTAGALLAELDTADLAASLQQLRGEVAVVQRRLDALRALEPREMHLAETVRDQAVAQADLAARNLERGTQLKAKALLPEQELEALASDAKVARARLANAEAALTQLATRFKTDIATLEAQLQQAQAAVRNADVQMEWGALRAPFDAVVFAVHQRPGELSSNQPGAPVLTLLKADELQVHVYVDESDFGKVRTGQPVSLQIEAHPGESVKGTIVRLLPQPILQENVVYYLALVEVDAAQRALLRAEMTTLAFIETGSGDPVLWVPSAAVRSRNGTWYVTRRGPDGPVEMPIQIGTRNEGRVEIRGGLAEGAEVVVP